MYLSAFITMYNYYNVQFITIINFSKFLIGDTSSIYSAL